MFGEVALRVHGPRLDREVHHDVGPISWSEGDHGPGIPSARAHGRRSRAGFPDDQALRVVLEVFADAGKISPDRDAGGFEDLTWPDPGQLQQAR